MPMSIRFTKKSLLRVPTRLVRTPWLSVVPPRTRSPANKDRHLGSAEIEQPGLVDEQVLINVLVALA